VTETLDDILARLQALPEDEREAVKALAVDRMGGAKWLPNPGPQTAAYFSEADVLLYGGAGGGGKSSLLAGLALTQHRRSLLMRRQYTDLNALIEDTLTFNGSRSGYSGAPPPRLRTDDGRLIEFGAAAKLGDEQHWQGQPHDFLGIDEATQFLELQIRFLMGWVRSTVEGQRTRVVLATNPPLSTDGQFIVGMFRPWLDATHPDPAEPGELRWFVTDPDGKDMEVEGPEPVEMGGETYIPKSRTFVPAALRDNPFLARTGYQAQLDAMPEPMRSAIRDGNFMAAREDDPWQVIPTAWVLAANDRWRKGRPVLQAMTALGLDVARGGRDSTVLSPRYGRWFDELTVVPGKDTPDGPAVAAQVAGKLKDNAPVAVDSIGIGAAAEDALSNAGLTVVAINGSTRSTRATRDGSFHFATRRSELWWLLREALDPEYGMDLALPPDPALQADLTAPTRPQDEAGG